MDSVKIRNIAITGIGGITHLSISFGPGLNLICGTNGIGKTTILECIAHAFVWTHTDKLKRNVKCTEGKCEIKYIENDLENTVSYNLTHFNPTGEKDHLNYLSEKSGSILYFMPTRNISYCNLQNLARDPERKRDITASEAYNGISSDDIKNWFIQRYMWSAHRDALARQQMENLDIAKQCFSLLDKDVKFSKVIPDTYDIMVQTPQGEVYFEYLSSGYKSCIYILLGIIKEIEYRFKTPHINAKDFSGVILIDEIDVHLHPEWQMNLLTTLKTMVPNAQIIATTHSPSMIQCAEANEIIPLQFDEEHNIIVKEVGSEKYGFQGWTLEEILTDVMGMKTIRSKAFLERMRMFDKAIEESDEDGAIDSYNELMLMLNPRSQLRKLLDIEIVGLRSDDKT